MWKLFTFALISLMSLALQGQTSHPILPLESPAPDFSLPGVDGKIHQLRDYDGVVSCGHTGGSRTDRSRIWRSITTFEGKADHWHAIDEPPRKLNF